MTDSSLSKWAIRHRALLIDFVLIIVLAGVGSYLLIGSSEQAEFILLGAGITLAAGLAAEEIIRLGNCPSRSNPPVEAKSSLEIARWTDACAVGTRNRRISGDGRGAGPLPPDGEVR